MRRIFYLLCVAAPTLYFQLVELHGSWNLFGEPSATSGGPNVLLLLGCLVLLHAALLYTAISLVCERFAGIVSLSASVALGAFSALALFCAPLLGTLHPGPYVYVADALVLLISGFLILHDFEPNETRSSKGSVSLTEVKRIAETW